MCDSTATALESPPLRRHNSIVTLGMTSSNKISPSTTSPVRTSSLDFELLTLKSPYASYTSLRDMLPSPRAAVNSPTASTIAINSGYEISIRNRLVKQAAWAYLQPMSASPGSSSSAPNFFRRLFHRNSSDNPLTACFSFFYHHVVSGLTRILHRILHAFSGQVST